jgi:hypothetical protein
MSHARHTPGRPLGNSYGGRTEVFLGSEIVHSTAPAATVDGIDWTVSQTKQAMADGRMCRCNRSDCACCQVKLAVRRCVTPS